jgi:NAD-dependent deacetylase
MVEKTLEENIEEVAELIVKSQRIVVFTGAGVSTESGIPDFRSPTGIWTKYDMEDTTIQRFLSSKDSRKRHWQMLLESGLVMTDAQPNLGHYAIVELDKMGKLDCVITQNVDGLHQKAGVPDDKVFQLHGDMSHVKCLSCGKRYPLEEIIEWLKQGVELPECELCHGILKPDAIFFGEMLPPDALAESERRSQSCDLCIVLGSSLVVYPAAYMPIYAVRAKAKLVIINVGPTELDRLAYVRIEGKSGEIMPQVIARVKEKLG